MSQEEGRFQLSNNRFVSVSLFKNKVRIDIREYYLDDNGDRKPGKKGISLSLDEWKKLKDQLDDIEKDVKKKGGNISDDSESDWSSSSSHCRSISCKDISAIVFHVVNGKRKFKKQSSLFQVLQSKFSTSSSNFTFMRYIQIRLRIINRFLWIFKRRSWTCSEDSRRQRRVSVHWLSRLLDVIYWWGRRNQFQVSLELLIWWLQRHRRWNLLDWSTRHQTSGRLSSRTIVTEKMIS